MLVKRALLSAVAVALIGGSAFAADPDPAKTDPAKPPQPFVYIAVTGAPGDGGPSLTAALAKRLAAIGVKEGSAQSAEVYSVEAIVEVTPASRGRQSVRIDWRVFAPDGAILGGASQTKLVRKGSLDKKWGAAALAAAAAASPGIAKLIPH
jgi:hypothetical protein